MSTVFFCISSGGTVFFIYLYDCFYGLPHNEVRLLKILCIILTLTCFSIALLCAYGMLYFY
jgi:hypothetical protein